MYTRTFIYTIPYTIPMSNTILIYITLSYMYIGYVSTQESR